MEDKSQAWYSLLEDSLTWNDTNATNDGTQSTDHFDRGPAASTFINSVTSRRAAPPRFSALASSCGQIFSPIHHTSKAAVTLPYGTPSKISDYLTEYSITTSELVANITRKSCDSPQQSNPQCTNTLLQSNDRRRLPILRSQNTSETVQQRPELRLQQTQKDVHPTRQTLEGFCEPKTKTNPTGSLVFPFPSDRNLHLQSGKQRRKFETSLAGSAPSSRTRPTDALKCPIDVNTESAIRKSFPDLSNPSLPIRAEPAGRDIRESLNQPSSAPPSTDDQENKVPVPNKRHDKVSKPNSGNMNSVVIESASKEQVRYKRTPQRNIRHEDLRATPTSSDEGMDAVISSTATGYATTLSTLLDYMTIDERVKLLPPSNLNVAPDPGGLSNNRDAVGRSRASTDSSPVFVQKGLSHCDKDERVSAEKRSNLQPPARPSVTRNIAETEDSMMPPVGNRDNFIPVGSESNIQTIGKSARFLRAVTVGGSSSSLSKKLDANIHITISKGPPTSSEVDIDNLLPIEERERFLPTGADSESLDKASSSSCSNTSDSNDDIHVSCQVNCVQDQVLNESFNPSTEPGLTPLHQELRAAELLDTKLEGATASCVTDTRKILTKKSTEEDYMDVVERKKYIKTDLFEACKDLPKNRGQESGFKDNFDRDQDKTNLGKSEPDLLLGHSSNFGICGPDLYPIIASGENIRREGNAGLSDRKPGFASGLYSAIPPSITLQDFENHTRPIMLPAQPLPFGDFTCPNEEDEDDTDELINMVSSVLLDPNNGISPNKSDPTAAGKLQYRSPTGVSDLSTPSGNPHLSQTNLNDNVSTGTSNPLTESGRGTLGSSDVSNSPPNGGDDSKRAEDQKLTSQDISYKIGEPSNTTNATNSKTENIVEVQTSNSSHESLGNSDTSSEIHNKSVKSVKISHVHPLYSERTSRSTDLYLPLSIAVKGSMDNTIASDLSSARSYDNDQSQDSDVLGRQVNSLLCRTAYLEYRNQKVQTSMVKNESNVIDRSPRSTTPLVPFAEAYEIDTGSNSGKSSYTEKEGLDYDQLKQDLADLQNSLTQGLQLKSPILKDEDIFVGINEAINKTGSSGNSPDVLQDSRIPTNLFRKTTQQQADLLLGMDRILRKKEDAFESSASVCLPLLAVEKGNEILQKKEYNEGGTTQNTTTKLSLPADVEMVSMVPEILLEDKPKSHSQTIQESAFVYPNQVNDHDNGVSLGSTQRVTQTPLVSDELALRVERILSEEPLYNMSNINFLDRIRPETGFFKKLSFSSDCKSTKAESISDLTETDSAPAESETSKDSFDKCLSDLLKNQKINEQDQDLKITGGFDKNAEEIYFGESVASRESSENFNCSTLSNSSHPMDSSKKERSLEVPDFADVQPPRKDITNNGNASDYRTKTGAFDNSSLAFASSKPIEETRSPHRFKHNEDVLVEPINFGHNETLPYPVNESSNSIKFLDEDVRRCLDWSNMSTFSSPPKETVPAAETVNLLTHPEMVENITDVDPESKTVNSAPISNISKNDPKRSRNGSISGKSTTNSSQSESDCPSLNTVTSVHAIFAERKLSKSSQLESHLQEDENSHQRSDAISTSSSSSSRNQKQKRSTNNISTQRIDLGFSSEDLRQLSKNLTQDDSLRLDNDVYISSKSKNSSQKSPYKLSLSESQPDFRSRNQTSRKSSHRSCSDINSLLHSEDPTPFLKPKGRSDIDSLRRDLDALSNYEQAGSNFLTPAILEREKPKESGDVSSLPSSKSFPSVSPSMVVSPFEIENDPVTAVPQSGDCSGLKRHSGDSTSVTSQFYESSTSREFVIGKASSSTSSTNLSRTSSAWISSRKSTSKGKIHDASVPVQTDDKLPTSVEVKYPLNQQRETAHHISPNQSNGVELNCHASKIYQTQAQSEKTDTKSSNGISSSPSGSEDSVASDKTWTLRPYKPAGSHKWYYTNYCDDLITGESGTTTLESADTGSDDAIGPPIPKEFLGSRVNVPSRPGIYSRAIHKKNIPIQEDLLLSTIHEKSLVDERDRSSRILEKRNSQFLYKTNGYSANNPTIEPGNLPTPSTKSVPLEFNARNKDLGGTSQTPQRIEQLVSKENISAPPLDQKGYPRPADIENLTEALYDDRRSLGTNNIETCREREKYPEKLAVNQSVIDLRTKNSSSFESGTTTVDTPSGFTDPDNVNNGFLRLSDPTLSSDESEQLQEIPCAVPQYHPLVRYAPANQWNAAEVQENQNISRALNASCLKKPGILSKRGSERVVRSSKELDLLWEKFQQQDHSSDHESSLDSARLGHMQQLLQNPTHALVHHSLAKKERLRLKQAKMAAHKREEQKRALLCSKIQDESSSITGSLYSNRNLSSDGVTRRDEGSISSRPSCTSDTLSSVAEERRVGPHQVGQPGESEAGLSDPIMAQLREKIDKQRKKCQQTKLRDKASEQKLQKLTHILVNRQMNDLVLAAEMRRLSTTSTASMTTASETLPKSQWENSYRNQPVVSQKKTNPVSKQQSDKYQHDDSHPPRLGQNERASQNPTGQEMVSVQRHGSKAKQKISRNSPNHKISVNSSEQDDASDHSDFQRRRPRMKDVATMVPSPKVVTDETSDEDGCQLIKASIGIQTSPPRKMPNHSRQPNVYVAKQPQPNRTTKSPPVKNLGTTTSPHKSTSVEEVQVIPVPFLSTPKRYKNMTNEAIDKAFHNNVEKISVDKESDSWFISLSDQPTNNTHSSRQQQQHTQLMRPFTGNPKAKGRQNKLPPRKPQGLTKKPAGHSRALFNHAVVPAHRSPPGSSQKMLAITNAKFNGIDNQTTLQDAFNNHMKSWISRSRERQKRIALAADERRYQEQMELEREEIFLNKKAPTNIIPHPLSDNLHQPKKRDLSKKEIKELNQRFYKKLPEVVQHKVLLNRATEYRTNRIRSRMFSIRVQKSLLTKTTCR